ncbi:anhydro-N-acetylmuramic acid kinase [Vibrio paucivorans]|uniref:Anhydro-N-acetylmuramic acid kinase n=1 Tax=Vibrio paucivorans TaxID=2829489 RepID=A0A9X3CG20_9VIBR|nr:anhydro-N-acetylmuramic acid kinase [Vibrio paucivorans]MCW8335194.1 anhydro-N-acetylmuramic acid kinase [Vibrio paucivorans]
MESRELYIGVMSGTSLDGVDTVLTEISDGKVTLLASNDFAIPEALKQRVLNVCLGQDTNLVAIGQLDHDLGHLYADAILELLKKSGYQAQQITAIGNHGQTVYHQPNGPSPFTMQLGDANIIATRTGITTIADFRRKDMALGGQGAPLVPAFHQSLFQSQHSSVVVLNIGGIANISVLRPNQKVIGYDTGPGNMLMDAWCQKHTGRKYDADATFAKQGQLITPLLERLLQEDYLSQQPPKSTGRELFNLPWLENILTSLSDTPELSHDVNATAENIQRTLCEYTALTIANDVERYSVGAKPELFICGGGVHNPLLIERLNALLPRWRVDSTTNQGIDSDNMEAMAFAWLAHQRIHNLPSNLPEVTGAKQLASLGVLYLADS